MFTQGNTYSKGRPKGAQILKAFRHLWRHEYDSIAPIPDNEIKVRIIQPNHE